ncbi:replication initiation factor family protein [Paenibacillus farraposensis]|uniref:Replication initiation factor family protein n=1 Tax=Paenibacillus farraposensis TaxID=2807095 RepID=A0ABW4DJW4_9BACL|nr:replication initiation factor family protein [Paenibacillus farraposensis]MCC3378522.1 replication initiation factor family protein [Paenibacillus farraposensis]
MNGVTVSIDRIVIDFTDVYWDFFNEFHKQICHYYGVRMTVGERGFQYRIRINTGEQFLHISYKLVFAPKTRKNTLRIEVYPKSLVYFRHWLEQIREYADQVLFVRCDVAFDIPVRISDLFTMSTKGRKLRLFKGTRYYNGKHQRQEDGYCRVYDKKRQLLETGRQKIRGERTRMEIVYASKEKISLATLVQYPPQFNSKYLCAVLTDLSKFSPKVGRLVKEIQQGELLPQDTTPYYRKQIHEQMKTQEVIDLTVLAAEQWQEAITLPCAILSGKISHLPVQEVHSS